MNILWFIQPQCSTILWISKPWQSFPHHAVSILTAPTNSKWFPIPAGIQYCNSYMNEECFHQKARAQSKLNSSPWQLLVIPNNSLILYLTKRDADEMIKALLGRELTLFLQLNCDFTESTHSWLLSCAIGKGSFHSILLFYFFFPFYIFAFAFSTKAGFKGKIWFRV